MDTLRITYERKLAERPGFYSVLRTTDGAIVRGTTQFSTSWAEAAVTTEPVHVVVVDRSRTEISASLSAAVLLIRQNLPGGAAIVGTYTHPDQTLSKVRLVGVSETEIAALNKRLDDPHVLCEDNRMLPRRYGSRNAPPTGSPGGSPT